MAIQPIAAAQPPRPLARPLEELEDQLYTQLAQRMGEVQKSWTRWTLLAAGVFVFTAQKVGSWWSQPEDRRPFCDPWDEDLEEASLNPIFNQTCPNPEYYCPQIPEPLLENINLYLGPCMGAGFLTLFFASEGSDKKLLNVKKAIKPSPVDSHALNASTHNTFTEIHATPEFPLLVQRPAQLQNNWPEQLRKRRLLFYGSIFPTLTIFNPQTPDFNARMTALMTTLIIRNDGLKQLQDIQTCHHKVAMDRLVIDLTRINFLPGTRQIVFSYYFAVPVHGGDPTFEFNHPVFW